MSQNKIKKKSLKNRRKLIAVILAISLYFLISFMSTIFGIGNKTILPETGTLYDKSNGEAFVIKDETLYSAKGSGRLNLLVKEGDRVGVGVEIANIILLNGNSQLKEDLIEVEQQIAILSKKNSNSNMDTSLDSMTNDLIENIQKNISSEEFSDIYNTKEEFSAFEKYSTEDSLLNQSIESLNAQRESLINQINEGSVRYYSQSSGIVSYEIDGYENYFLPKDFESYTYDKIQVKEFENNKIDDKVNIGDSVFKIINNYEWYMAIKIKDKKDIEDYVIGNTMKIELEDETELNGKIVTINFSGDKAVVVLKFNTYLHSNYNLRHTEINLIHSKKEGYKIPTCAITERDGNKGVYIKEINGIVKFRPIIILGEEGDFTFISKGNGYGYIELVKDEPVKTITLFDEIFINHSAVIEGEILK